MQYRQIEEILGGAKAVGMTLLGPLDLIEVASRGLQRSTVTHLARYLSLSMADMAHLLPVTERTLQRYAPRQRLNPGVSEHVLQLAEVVAHGSETFGSREKFLSWLDTPSAAFGDRTPLSLMASRFGIEMIEDELVRIDHGIPA